MSRSQTTSSEKPAASKIEEAKPGSACCGGDHSDVASARSTAGQKSAHTLPEQISRSRHGHSEAGCCGGGKSKK